MVRLMSLAVVLALVAGVARAEQLAVGAKAPAFQGKGTDGKEYSLDGMKDAKVVVVCFTCNRCPVAIEYEDRFIAFSKKYKEQGVQFIAINVNPETLDAMRERAEEKGFPFPYVKDESGASAIAYGARVTPHLYVLDGERKLAYVGAFDVDGKPHLQNAVDAILKGEKPSVAETRAVGCGIAVTRR